MRGVGSSIRINSQIVGKIGLEIECAEHDEEPVKND
jgi:hypothetical protein